MTHQGHGTRRPSRHRAARVAAVAATLGLLATACGGGSDETSTSAGTAAETDTSAGTDAGTTPGGSEAPATEAPGPAPTPGGKVVMAVEADTSSPWRPAEMLCAVACHQIARAVYDPLVLPTSDGGWAPYLAESVTPNADYTVWTIKVRPGVSFHDGTPLDGAAVADNLERDRKGFITGNILLNVESVAVDPADPLAVNVTMKSPWVPFPHVLAVSQIDYIASPAWLAASDADDTLKSKPVGTGPFVFVDYVPNEYFRASKNPNYWNAPYPYLDEIEFRPISDAVQRRDALVNGSVDLIHHDNGEVMTYFRDNADQFTQVEIDNEAETNYQLLHVTQVLDDGTQSPLTDQRVRCALVYANDQPTLNATLFNDVFPLANGPFSEQQDGYMEETGFPQAQDMDRAKELIADYKTDHPGPLNLSLATTQDETNLTVAQFRQQWWQEAGVDNVTIDQIDQGTFILTAAQGNFQIFGWRNHGGFDLDNQYIWWHSSTAVPIGQLALNFGRIKDPVIDQALEANRAETDPAKKQEHAETINKRFAEQCYNIWTTWDVWGIASKPTVHGVETFTMPGGETSAFGSGISGTFYDMTLWVEQ